MTTFVYRDYVVNCRAHWITALQGHVDGLATYGTYGLGGQYFLLVLQELRIKRPLPVYSSFGCSFLFSHMSIQKEHRSYDALFLVRVPNDSLFRFAHYHIKPFFGDFG